MKRLNKKTLFLICIIFTINIFVLFFSNLQVQNNCNVKFTVKSNKADKYQVFYNIENSGWTEEQSIYMDYNKVNQKERLSYTIPMNTQYIRLDIGENESTIKIEQLEYGTIFNKIDITHLIKDATYINQIGYIKDNDDGVEIKSVGNDPYIILDLPLNELMSQNESINNIIKILICIVIDIIGYILSKKLEYIIGLFKELYDNKRLIWSLAKNDFKTKYAGSYLGIIWAFIQPIVTILLYWFVFQFGLRAGDPLKDVPFILWFMAGLIPWFFFSDSFLNATNCMMEYSYLVKKVVFKISILPVVKTISTFFVHLVFIFFLFIVAMAYGFMPSVYTIQLIYYLICIFCLALGMSYASCAIVVFFKDLGQIINILLQIGMWMTPIMWNATMVSQRFQWVLKLNPIYYITEGYRDTFINKVFFFEKTGQTMYFWIVVLLIFIAGTTIFKKLRPHFADVL